LTFCPFYIIDNDFSLRLYDNFRRYPHNLDSVEIVNHDFLEIVFCLFYATTPLCEDELHLFNKLNVELYFSFLQNYKLEIRKGFGTYFTN